MAERSEADLRESEQQLQKQSEIQPGEIVTKETSKTDGSLEQSDTHTVTHSSTEENDSKTGGTSEVSELSPTLRLAEPERILMTIDTASNDLEELKCEEALKSDYILPLQDPLGKANIYFAKHDILQLFQNITAGIAYHRPKDPLDFMIDQIERLQEIDRKKKGVIKQPASSDSNESQQNIEKQAEVVTTAEPSQSTPDELPSSETVS